MSSWTKVCQIYMICGGCCERIPSATCKLANSCYWHQVNKQLIQVVGCQCQTLVRLFSWGVGNVIVRFTEKSGKSNAGRDWLILPENENENIFADALEDDDDDVCCLIAGKRIIGPPASLNALSCMCHLSSLRCSNTPAAIRVLKLPERFKLDKFRTWFGSCHSNKHDAKLCVLCTILLLQYLNAQMSLWRHCYWEEWHYSLRDFHLKSYITLLSRHELKHTHSIQHWLTKK